MGIKTGTNIEFIRRIRRQCMLLPGAFLLTSMLWAQADPGVIRTMVVTGGHPFDTSFDSLFEGYPDISAKVYPRDVAYKQDLRRNWDVLVMYDLTTDITEIEQKHLRDFLEAGKGLVVLHHAIADYGGWAWWTDEVVGARYFLKDEPGHPRSTYHQGTDVVYTPVPHPVTAGIEPLHLTDETYKGYVIGPKVKPLLKSDHPLSESIAAWIGPYEKARVVVIQPGHDRKTHLHPGYRLLVRNAILWTAGK